MINVKPRIEEERKGRYQNNQSSSLSEKPRERIEEARKPRLNLKQSYFEHIQRLTKYNNDVAKNDYSKIVVNFESLQKNHIIPFSPSESEDSGKFKLENFLIIIFSCKICNENFQYKGSENNSGTCGRL